METTITKGLRLIDQLAEAEEPVGVTATANELGFEKSNVHRMLRTLCSHGFADQDANGRYALTLKVWEIGMKVIARHPVVRAARPFMHMLSQRTQETINLVVLDELEIVYLEQVRGPMPVRLMPSMGHRAPAMFTASGRILLAYQNDCEKLVAKFRSDDPRGAQVNKSALLRELVLSKERGFAITESGWSPGINSIAAAIANFDQKAYGAIAISGPAERMPLERMHGLANELLNACSQAVGSIRANPPRAPAVTIKQRRSINRPKGA